MLLDKLEAFIWKGFLGYIATFPRLYSNVSSVFDN